MCRGIGHTRNQSVEEAPADGTPASLCPPCWGWEVASQARYFLAVKFTNGAGRARVSPPRVCFGVFHVRRRDSTPLLRSGVWAGAVPLAACVGKRSLRAMPPEAPAMPVRTFARKVALTRQGPIFLDARQTAFKNVSSCPIMRLMGYLKPVPAVPVSFVLPHR